ncbi:MAG: amino acid permease [Myxococcales bacterium]|nr:amino acid permease [Myxococcales bacterium]MDH3483619.1 amino acid permease [Myxococcales bacterium]
MKNARWLDLGSGIGLVVASMVGAGVFLSAGFMAQELSAGLILVAWGVGAVLAMAGARTYAEASVLIPRSGGEYRYLSELIHPAVGYLAGWASLLVGFAAPTAISAYGASAFAQTVVGAGDTRLGATALILVLTLLHAAGLRLSKWTQNSLILVNAILIVGFIAVGLSLGSHEWPTWVAPNRTDDFVALPFARSLFFVAYAFSGWNAAAYAAEEFHNPVRDVPRAMLIGCGLVGILYLLVNWVLVANLTPEQAKIVFQYEEARVTLGHIVAQQFLGGVGSSIMSVAIAIAMLSSMSAMLLVGPRVYAEMARDGFLPSVLRGQPGAPPRTSVFVQGTLAVILLHLHSIGELLSNVAGVLVLFSALVAVGLFLVRRRRPHLASPRPQALFAAFVYASSSAWMLYSAFRSRTGLLPWLGVVAVAGLGGYLVTERRRGRART